MFSDEKDVYEYLITESYIDYKILLASRKENLFFFSHNKSFISKLQWVYFFLVLIFNECIIAYGFDYFNIKKRDLYLLINCSTLHIIHLCLINYDRRMCLYLSYYTYPLLMHTDDILYLKIDFRDMEKNNHNRAVWIKLIPP